MRTVVDATGVGGGLTAFLQAALPAGSVVPWLYTAVSKAKLGYDLLTAINANRLKVFGDVANVAQSSRAISGESYLSRPVGGRGSCWLIR